MADIEEVARAVTEILSELKLHDQRARFAVEQLSGTQERIGQAVEKIADATQAIRSFTEKMDTRERERPRGLNGWKLTPSSAAWLVGGSLAVGAALAGGSELARRVIQLLPAMPR